MKSNQAGGIVSFVIVAVALAGLLGGGLYLSKQMGREARTNDTSGPNIAEVKEEAKEAASSSDEDKKGAETTKPTVTETKKPEPVTPAAPTPTQPRDRVATTGPSDELPATGAGETAAVILALSVVSFAGYYWHRSRRDMLRTALRR